MSANVMRIYCESVINLSVSIMNILVIFYFRLFFFYLQSTYGGVTTMQSIQYAFAYIYR